MVKLYLKYARIPLSKNNFILYVGMTFTLLIVIIYEGKSFIIFLILYLNEKMYDVKIIDSANFKY